MEPLENFWKIALSVAGLASIGSFVLWSLYKQWLSLPIFSTLKKQQQFHLLRLFLILSFIFAALALLAYVILERKDRGRGAEQTDSVKILPIDNISRNNVKSLNDKALATDQLEASEYFRQGLVYKALGRDTVAEGYLSSAIEISPNFVKARVARNRLEDKKYLVDNNSIDSLEPYILLAKFYAENGSEREAISVLEKASYVFPDKGVVILDVEYSSSLIDLESIRRSLELRGDTGDWNTPRGRTNWTIVVDDSMIIVHKKQGLNLKKETYHEVIFKRFGFEDYLIRIPSNSFKPGTITRHRLVVRNENIINSTNNIVRGKAARDGQEHKTDIKVELSDFYNENYGFEKEVITDSLGNFSFTNVPNGKFVLKTSAPEYVSSEYQIEVGDGKVRCHFDAYGRYTQIGRTCDLSEFELLLFKTKNILLSWTLQEDPARLDFNGNVSQGEVILKSGLSHDWTRGNYSCCGSAYKFGSAETDPTKPDILLFTELNGRSYFGIPYSAPSIAISHEDYDGLTDLGNQPPIKWKNVLGIFPNNTYLLKTFRDKNNPNMFLVKFKILSVF